MCVSLSGAVEAWQLKFFFFFSVLPCTSGQVRSHQAFAGGCCVYQLDHLLKINLAEKTNKAIHICCWNTFAHQLANPIDSMGTSGMNTHCVGVFFCSWCEKHLFRFFSFLP